jgi:glycosyltransferase involved in cell wall biosynthesis
MEPNESCRPLVSIIVTTYNVADFLAECIRSIQAQTYQDLEIIIIDDGSSDHSTNIAESIAATDFRIKSHKNTKNQGGLYTKLDGIRKASGDYFFICDGDDWISPNLVEKCLTKIQHLDCLIYGFELIDHPTKAKIKQQYPIKIVQKIESGLELTNFEWGSISHIMPICFYSSRIRESLLNVYLNYPPLPYYDDIPAYALTMSLEKKTIIPEAFYYYRVNRPGQSTENWWDSNRSLKYLSLYTAICTATSSPLENKVDAQEIMFFKLLKIAFVEYRGILINNPREYKRLKRALVQALEKTKTPAWLWFKSIKAALFFLALRRLPSGLTIAIMPKLFRITNI